MAVVALLNGISTRIRLTHDRTTPVMLAELSITSRQTHDRETQVALKSLSVREHISPRANNRIANFSMRNAGVIDPVTGDRTPFYRTEGDVTDTM